MRDDECLAAYLAALLEAELCPQQQTLPLLNCHTLGFHQALHIVRCICSGNGTVMSLSKCDLQSPSTSMAASETRLRNVAYYWLV